MPSITLQPIGTVRSTRATVIDDDWDREEVFIELAPHLPEEALLGLDAFSHAEIVFYMDQVEPAKIETAARHPRNNQAWPRVGILAQRGKNRPNQLGLSVCRVLSVSGRNLRLEGLDAVDGTPVLDIKPWVREFGPRGEVLQPPWISELMKGYWSG
jgi:tRNA-Thr(GGU) m(6)t(6)A37 methyltransferase TsaA